MSDEGDFAPYMDILPDGSTEGEKVLAKKFGYVVLMSFIEIHKRNHVFLLVFP